MLQTITLSIAVGICKYSTSKSKATSIYAVFLTLDVPPRSSPFANLTRGTGVQSTSSQRPGGTCSGMKRRYPKEWALLAAVNLRSQGPKCSRDLGMITGGTVIGYFRRGWITTSAAESWNISGTLFLVEKRSSVRIYGTAIATHLEGVKTSWNHESDKKEGLGHLVWSWIIALNLS